MIKIIYTRPDGGLSIVHLAENVRLKDETDVDFAARIAAKDVPPDAANVRFVDSAIIPIDRTFRDAWKQQGAAIVTDIVKAREVAKTMLSGKGVDGAIDAALTEVALKAIVTTNK